VRLAGICAVLCLVACSRKQEHEARPRSASAAPATAPAPAAPAATAPTATAPQKDDLAWLVGTWERQSAPKDWLLFNAPKDVMVLSGKPVSVTRRGEFVAHGRFVSLIFHQPGGNSIERELEAPPDRSELREKTPVPVTYRRGAPP